MLVFNGDVLCGTDLRAVVGTHRETAADVTLHLVRVPDPRAFGCVPTDASGQVLAFLEKTEDPPTDQINAGCYVFRRSVIDSIPRAVRSRWSGRRSRGCSGGRAGVRARRQRLLARHGQPADLVHGSADLVRGVAPSAALPGPTGEALVLDGAEIAADALVFGGSTVGRGVTIGAGARVDGSMLFDGAVVAPGAVVEQSVVGAGARIERAPRCATRWSATARWSARTASCGAGCGCGPTSCCRRTGCASPRMSEPCG